MYFFVEALLVANCFDISKNIAADFIATLDKDGDGKITFLELLKEMYPMTPSKRLNDIYRKYYPEAVPKGIKFTPPPRWLIPAC